MRTRSDGRSKRRTKRMASEPKELQEKLVDEAERSLLRQPHSMIIHRGLVGPYVRCLIGDLRALMEPYTASRLKVMKRNNLRDFIENGSIFGVTHLLVVTRGEHYLTLRMMRSPQGPTLSFRIKAFTLARQVLSSLKKKIHFQEQFKAPPLVVMNGFSSSDNRHLQLVQSMFQNMFPTMNVDTVKLAGVRRCVLLNYDSETNTIDLRHYAIKAVPSGLSRSAKKLVQSKVPDLSKYNDIGDYFLNPGQLSESEYEFEQKEVELPQNLTTRGCTSGQKTNIRLYELGPRISLELIKIEEGIDDGEVLYHAYMKKSANELMALKRGLTEKRNFKEKQRKIDEYRVVRRLKAIANEKEKLEQEFEMRKQKLIRKQNEVTGDNDNDNDDRQSSNQEGNQQKTRYKQNEPSRKRRGRH